MLKTRYEKEEKEEEIRYENPKEGFDSTYVSLLMSCTKKKDKKKNMPTLKCCGLDFGDMPTTQTHSM